MHQTEKINILSAIPLFAELGLEDLDEIARMVDFKDFKKGTELFKQGQKGREMFIIFDGQVEIILHGDGRNVQLKVVDAPNFVGEMALFLDSPRTASVIATEDTRCFTTTREPFVSFAKKHPDILLELNQLMSYRLLEAHDKIVELTGDTRSSRMKELLDKLDFED